MIISSRFRRQVKVVLVKKCWQRLKSCCCLGQNQVSPENQNTSGTDMDMEEN